MTGMKNERRQQGGGKGRIMVRSGFRTSGRGRGRDRVRGRGRGRNRARGRGRPGYRVRFSDRLGL